MDQDYSLHDSMDHDHDHPIVTTALAFNNQHI